MADKHIPTHNASDILLAMIRAGYSDDLAASAANIVREARTEAEYELYEDVMRAKGNKSSVISYAEFKEYKRTHDLASLFTA